MRILGRHKSRGYDSLRLMASAFEASSRRRRRPEGGVGRRTREELEIAAELAVARAKASEDTALIAAQKLRIAKLERQIYGRRSERSARLIEQLSLAFEELEASATEDELAAETAVAKATTVAPSRVAPPSAARSPTTSARARRDRSSDRL